MATLQENTQKKNFPFGGLLLIIGGLFFFLTQFVHITLSGGVILGAIGLFFILWGAVNRTAGLFVPGGILTGLSSGVFLVEDTTFAAGDTLEGGVILLCLAAGFALIPVLTWLFTRSLYWWAWIVSAVLALIGAGLVILAVPQASTLQRFVEAAFTASQYLWPLFLVGLGIWIIMQKRADAAQ